MTNNYVFKHRFISKLMRKATQVCNLYCYHTENSTVSESPASGEHSFLRMEEADLLSPILFWDKFSSSSNVEQKNYNKDAAFQGAQSLLHLKSLRKVTPTV